MFPTLKHFVEALDMAAIPLNRKSTLQPLIDYIQAKVVANKVVNLNFICTHNSRRSHLSQLWAQIMATYFEIPMV